MNEIVMIPVEELIHHPENPRKDLGDLTELAESIKANGVMQNLTVIKGHQMTKAEYVKAARAEGADKVSAEASYRPEDAWASDGYTVVIGNRRMEAAKIAGLAELPCVISDMDHKTQVATMLMENMQRQDLTVYEQAQGFQMMMDLGYSAKEIGEKTGFGETTVRRRIKMAELDPKLLKKACEDKETERQVTLAQVEDIKTRNELLKDIGDRNFDWMLRGKLRKQKAAKVRPEAERILKEAKLKQISKDEQYSGKYNRLYTEQVDLCKWTPEEKLIPETKGELFYLLGEEDVSFFVKAEKQKSEPAKKTPEQIAEEKQIEQKWKICDRIAEAGAEMRKTFVESMTVNPNNAMRMMQWMMIAAFGSMEAYNSPTYGLKLRLGLETHTIPEQQEELAGVMMKLPQKKWPGLILLMFEGDWAENKRKVPGFADGTRKEFPKFKRNVMLELCYAWLTEYGYKMSDEEIRAMGGTHECFAEDK